MHYIVFLERDAIHANFRRPVFAHTWAEHPSSTADQVETRLAAATIAIVNKVPMRGELLARLPQLKMIAMAATGADCVDLDYCRRHGIVVSNIRGYAVHAVPEHALMLMLALRRQLAAYRADVAAGRWQQSPVFCLYAHELGDLHGATLGLFGRGALGQGVARLAEAFGMRVLWGEHKGATMVREGYVQFAQVLAEADVISLHCPLTAATRGMIGAAEIDAMKPGAILINTARGGLGDEVALVGALRAGRISAGFDVLSEEPPRHGHPLMAPDILALPNFILTPHVAWASDAAMQTLADQLIDNIEAFDRGEPRNRIA